MKLLIASALTSLAMLSPAVAENMLRVSYSEDPKTADGQMTTDSYTLPLNIFDRLVESETTAPGESALVPGLAEKWEVSEDGLTYTFHLRQGVKFHDGAVLTADDVVYTFDRMLNPATKALNTDILTFIAGAQDRLDGKADSVSGLKALDDQTVQITLAQPYAAFLALLAAPGASIYNRAFTEAAGDQFGLTPETTNGTGPFILRDYTLNDSQMLEANEDYWRGRAKVDRLLIRVVTDAETLRMLFESDEIDVFDLDYAPTQTPYFYGSDQWKDLIRSGPRVGIYYYNINQAKKPFDDPRVRKAFQMAIDRQTILDKNFYGKGALENGVMPRGLTCYAEAAPIEYNPAKAKELLAEAGYPDGVEIKLQQAANWSPRWSDMNQIIQAQIAEAGFKAQIVTTDEAAFMAARKVGETDNYTQVWSADFNDPDNFFYTFFSESGSKSRAYNNNDPEVFADIERARGMTDQAERCKLYQDLTTRIVDQDAAWVPLFSLDHSYVVQPRVKNFVVPWNGWSDMNYYNVEVE
ncbi:ABC transporter substrate-binding protein [Gemmobacter serpentinus]|uniref:ABC transporter substrate-binding protein n=1 Tax=Gemmobacter serpentinus TaxID=2652247 RepID=UPI001CF706CD|nr:ABC transporter substrate-binding protein [Gemmobacter serpentinus]